MASDTKHQPPSTPVAAATRPPPDSTDSPKDSALLAIRQARHISKLRKPEEFNPNTPEQKVAVFVNNGQHNGFRAIGRYFPNGLTGDVSVTEEELAELRAEPQDIIRVVDASEVAASLGGKGQSASLTTDEQKVLSHFRSSGQTSDAYLAQLQKTGTGTKLESGSSESSSKASTEEQPHTGKRK